MLLKNNKQKPRRMARTLHRKRESFDWLIDLPLFLGSNFRKLFPRSKIIRRLTIPFITFKNVNTKFGSPGNADQEKKLLFNKSEQQVRERDGMPTCDWLFHGNVFIVN